MAEMIPFPLQARAALIRSMADDLEAVHGPQANVFWRERVSSIVADMRNSGLADGAIRNEILDLHEAVQAEMQQRAGLGVSSLV
jgi:hypothetical protein